MMYTRAQIVNGTGFQRGALFAELSPEDVEQAREALAALDEAAEGDSNDHEIEMGRDVADILPALIGYESEE